jgi:class 3 adenylate cyclase/tetratricopeptide (TPR) repeat protein
LAMSASTCAACGEALPEGARFCPGCGATARSSPHEERKVVTAVFVDVVGSTASADGADPEDVRARLLPYFSRVRDELERFGGTVEKFIGDAVMALFGAPVAHDDDPERAVRAALAVQQAVAELGVAVRVGVATGEALVDLGASAAAGEPVAAGDVLNTAARLEAAAGSGEVLVSEATFRATAESFAYEDAGGVEARGKARPVPAWRALSAHEPQGGRRRHSAPFVGRGDELDLLVRTLLRAHRERTPQLVTLVGAPGIGKSRLVAELLQAVEGTDVVARHGRLLPYGDAAAALALGDVVAAEAGILHSDPAETARAKLAGALRALVDEEAAAWIESHLLPFVGLGGRFERDRREEAVAAWAAFAEALADRAPTVLVFEDVHWADDELLDFLVQFLARLGDAPLVVLCTARPELLERRRDWGGGMRNAATIALAPLAEPDVRLLLGRLLERSAEEIEPALVARVGGNPLYAEEYARAVAAGEDGTLPATVQGLIAARIDLLPPTEKEVLHAAATIGRRFWPGAAAALTGRAPDELEEALASLERKEFVRRERRSTVAGEVEYAFRHVLVVDVAYGQIPRARRGELHRAAGAWVAALAADREDRIELVAHHLAKAAELARAAGRPDAELDARAADALAEAGGRALALSAFEAADGFFARARALSRAAPDGRLLLAHGKARFHGRGDGYAELEAAAASLAGDPDATADALAHLAVIDARAGRPDRALERVEQAARLSEGLGRSPTRARVLAMLAGLMMSASRDDEAIALGCEALAIAEELALVDMQVHALTTIGVSRATKGDLAGGTADLERAIALAAAAGSPERIRACANLATLCANEGDLRRSDELGRQAWDAAARFGRIAVIRFLESERVGALYWQGDWAGAARLADALVVAGDAPVYVRSFARQIRAEMRLVAGDVQGAAEDATRDLEEAREARDPQVLLPALAIRARTALALGDRALAEEAADEALLLWEELPERPRPSFWVLDLALVLAALGRGRDFLAWSGTIDPPTRWLEAAALLAGGDAAGAAVVLDEIGSVPDTALARLLSAERALEDGASPSPDDVAGAAAFFAAVPADAYANRLAELRPSRNGR